jgi:DNA-binding NarL/FixJ family response regulator
VIHALVVDDQTLVRKGIRTLLELAGDVQVVGEAAHGEEALALLPRACPDVVLLDLKMPRLDGLGFLRAQQQRGRGGAPPVLILTTFDDTELVLDGIRAGARGYLLKDASLAQLLEAVRTLAGGGTLFQPAVTERVLAGVGHLACADGETGAESPLTVREREVLRLMAGGLSNREIASALGLADGTVKNHVSSILSKLGARDRTRAVLKGLELSWI